MADSVISQGMYQGALANPVQLRNFLYDMLTQGGRGIAGPNGQGTSSYTQVYADLQDRISKGQVDSSVLAGLPTPGDAIANPQTYKGINAAGMPQLAGSTPVDNSLPPVTAPVVDPNADAKSIIKTELTQWGLGSLSDWAFGLLTQGAGQDQIISQLRDTNEYKQRFAGNVARQANGLTPLSESDYIDYENQAKQMLQSELGTAGAPYATQDELAAYIGHDKSVNELKSDVDMAASLVFSESPEVRMEAARLGLGKGDLVAAILDKDGTYGTLPILQQKVQQAQIAGQADITGFGQISLDQAARLAGLGITETQAQQGFASLAKVQPLLQGFQGEEGISTDQALAAQFGGDQNAAAALSRRQAQRLGTFTGGGSFATTSKGAGGLGTAT